ncbi:hypothetical protein ACHAW5_004792 [Stephanodiscus triporus]|uniref:Uncharacterized protein n=1 Tax=Stephanodiscus triporus TaxID=2934178 RepID=A0ABD3MNR9_9STRA
MTTTTTTSAHAMAGIVGTICRRLSGSFLLAVVVALSHHHPPPAVVGLVIVPPIRGSSAAASRRPSSSSSSSSPTSTTSTSSSSLRALRWPTLDGLLPWPPVRRADDDDDDDDDAAAGEEERERNGLDPEYPWSFEGRFVFRPSLVRVDADPPPPSSAELLSLFGYTLGGTVVLEYDVSPVGSYREYVIMGGIVGLGRVDVGGVGGGGDDGGRLLCLGQWGTELYVSTDVAEDVCRRVWGVPARVAKIELVEEGRDLVDGTDDDRDDDNDDGGKGGRRRRFVLSGWGNARILNDDDVDVDATTTRTRWGNVPIFWTPTIKALWAPISLPGGGGGRKNTSSTRPGGEEGLLPLHRLRLSASALGLRRCRRIRPHGVRGGGEIPLGFALVVDDVLIEIGERFASGNR